jgi:SAM-dependent methyltransferase
MPDWNTLFIEKENRWVDPYEDVVELAASRMLPEKALILDLGCGAGRHLQYLERMQNQPVGMDNAWNGLQASKNRLAEVKLPCQILLADMTHVFPFPNGCFDGIISIHVIFHNPRKVIEGTLAEMYRVLKPGGIVMVTFNAVYGSRYGHGQKIEESTWLLDEGVDRGVPHHFSDLADVADLMSGFKVLKVRLEEKSIEGSISAHWVVTARRY